MKKIILFVIVLNLIFSCADQYSVRKRTLSDKGTYYKSNEVIVETHKESDNQDNNSPQAVVEVADEEPILDENEENSISVDLKIDKVLETAYSYLGTPYKYGGVTRSGIDCSGLVVNAFKEADIPLARSAFDMSEQGTTISLRDIEVGDLLFFATGRGRKIRHVGIVVEQGREIKFIHASTSEGVIISSLEEPYWSKSFRKAKRVF